MIKKLCDILSITNKTKISHLITRISDNKKLDGRRLERVDIIFDYGLPTIDCQPPVIAYTITVESPNLIVKQLSNPRIRQFVNLTVKTSESINLEIIRRFPCQPDIRAVTRSQRRAILPLIVSTTGIPISATAVTSEARAMQCLGQVSDTSVLPLSRDHKDGSISQQEAEGAQNHVVDKFEDSYGTGKVL